MAITLVVPKYAHPRVGMDERIDRKIADVMDAEEKLPDRCGDCGAAGSVHNPLMMRPYFKMADGSGLPRSTLYQCRCSDCQVKRVRRR